MDAMRVTITREPTKLFSSFAPTYEYSIVISSI